MPLTEQTKTLGRIQSELWQLGQQCRGVEASNTILEITIDDLAVKVEDLTSSIDDLRNTIKDALRFAKDIEEAKE